MKILVEGTITILPNGQIVLTGYTVNMDGDSRTGAEALSEHVSKRLLEAAERATQS